MKRLKPLPLFAVASATFFIACAPASGQGTVTSVSNSDGTLTISPTAGNVVASIALGHANTWINTVSILTTNPTGTVLALGFEPNTLTVGATSFVTLTNAGAVTGTSGFAAQLDNQQTSGAGANSGLYAAVKDGHGSENYAVLGAFEVAHDSSNGAIGGFFLRGAAVAPNPLPYSGNNGISIVNENTISTGTSFGAIGLYVANTCYPTSVGGNCPQNGANDNRWTIGLNIVAAKDEGLRIGSSVGNGFLPTLPIAIYSNAGSLIWNVDSSGGTAIGTSSTAPLYAGYTPLNISGPSGASINLMAGTTSEGRIIADSSSVYLVSTGSLVLSHGSSGVGIGVATISAGGLAVNSGQLSVAGMTNTSSAVTGILCYDAATGAITYDTRATSACH